MIRIFSSLPKDLERVIKVGLSAVDAIILARKSAVRKYFCLFVCHHPLTSFLGTCSTGS